MAFVLATGCKDNTEPKEKAPARFQAVKRTKKVSSVDWGRFCEVHYPASGEGQRHFDSPPERELSSPLPPAAKAPPGWHWVNLWASWCEPCLAEMPLLTRWKKTLASDGVDVGFEFWSVDEEESDMHEALKKHGPFPGVVHLLRSQDDLPALLDGLGVDQETSIPIHALVDEAGQLRCVRVGEVKEEAYGIVRKLLSES